MFWSKIKNIYQTLVITCSLLLLLVFWCGIRQTGEVSDCIESIQYSGNVENIQKIVNKTEIEPGISVEELAYHWAPVHYQDISPVGRDKARVDYITRIDRGLPGREGGIWDYRMIQKKLNYPLRAHVYYSVVTSETHHFITYTFYHPWDTSVYKFPVVGKKRVDRKKIDLEGVLFIIIRNEKYGQLEAVLAQSHGYIHTYLPFTENDTQHTDYKKYSRIRHWRSLIKIEYSSEAMKSMNDNVMRVITSQEEGRHGAGCYPDWGAPSCTNPRNKNKESFGLPNPGGGDHIRYIPWRGAGEEPDFNDIYDRGPRYTYTRYHLINVFDPDGGLWYNRHKFHFFKGYRHRFIGDHGTPLWLWHGTSDGIFCDNLKLTDDEYNLVKKDAHPWTHNPANLARVYLQVDGDEDYYSDDYTWNNYLDDCLTPVIED